MSRAQRRECDCMTQLPIVGEAAAACQIGSHTVGPGFMLSPWIQPIAAEHFR